MVNEPSGKHEHAEYKRKDVFDAEMVTRDAVGARRAAEVNARLDRIEMAVSDGKETALSLARQALEMATAAQLEGRGLRIDLNGHVGKHRDSDIERNAVHRLFRVAWDKWWAVVLGAPIYVLAVWQLVDRAF